MNSVIIVAAGSGKRMNMGINKQFIKLNEKEIIAHTIETFYKNENIDEIIVCIKKEEEEFFKDKIIDRYSFKNIKIAYGGKERQDSIYNGLKLIDSRCEIVLIHDGARPFVSERIINNSIKVAREKKAVVVGMPVKDTIKFVDDGSIKDTPNRENLWSAQTPQSFEYKLIMRAYEEAYKHDYYGTDDSMLVEKIGQQVTMIMGSYDNIKITSPEDIGIGEQILNLQKHV
ncbi:MULTISPECIES: 2-C-methyl-D-erythritol 4-phosphate cytidylyltransferase [unclassified Romboutsia]|uniref:2-C-methyl-D-erythritol 4-phosphate cytidylyltransferase n=1 Tax=unclassified Romboutsia TaxID=2626894 RepID=UPI000820EAE9|nr:MULTISPECIES: 2-C-methyl-D-erythritol 4-phosphate cytidylyltransferase [unclassified Romboutsia]SCI47111.1 Putative 2-C-methyl-D-erythritol 4-phosphate cytidylyltransferase 2 [uncultured Clostridium sp.]